MVFNTPLIAVAFVVVSLFGAQQVYASNNNDNDDDESEGTLERFGKAADRALADGKQGYADGQIQGGMDYPNYNGACPRSDNDYCVGYTAGYIRGYDAAGVLDPNN